jgi:hypothetical protein
MNKQKEALGAALEFVYFAKKDVITNEALVNKMLELQSLLQETLNSYSRMKEKAWLFTNIQSGGVEASTDPDCFPREEWVREPLYTKR